MPEPSKMGAPRVGAERRVGPLKAELTQNDPREAKTHTLGGPRPVATIPREDLPKEKKERRWSGRKKREILGSGEGEGPGRAGKRPEPNNVGRLKTFSVPSCCRLFSFLFIAFFVLFCSFLFFFFLFFSLVALRLFVLCFCSLFFFFPCALFFFLPFFVLPCFYSSLFFSFFIPSFFLFSFSCFLLLFSFSFFSLFSFFSGLGERVLVASYLGQLRLRPIFGGPKKNWPSWANRLRPLICGCVSVCARGCVSVCVRAKGEKRRKEKRKKENKTNCDDNKSINFQIGPPSPRPPGFFLLWPIPTQANFHLSHSF